MVAIHPSLTLVLDLDEALGTQETKLEIARCYSYVGTPLVRTHPASPEGTPRNVARFIVSMGTKKYLLSSDDGADERWAESVEPWLASMFFKVCNTAAAFNKRMRKIDMPEITFDRVDVELQGGRFIVGLHPSPENLVPRSAAKHVGEARALLNSGAIGDAVRVNAPGNRSWQDQLSRARALWNEAHPEGEDAQQDTGTPPSDVAAEPTGALKHTVGPMPDWKRDPEAFNAWEEADREAKSYENTAVPPTDSDDLPPIGNPVEPAEPPRFDFDVDYTLWDIVDAEGRVRTFDSSTQTFLD